MLDDVDFSVGIAIQLVSNERATLVMAFLIRNTVFVVVKLLAGFAPVFVEVNEHVFSPVAIYVHFFTRHEKRRISVGIFVEDLDDLRCLTTPKIRGFDSLGTLTFAQKFRLRRRDGRRSGLGKRVRQTAGKRGQPKKATKWPDGQAATTTRVHFCHDIRVTSARKPSARKACLGLDSPTE